MKVVQINTSCGIGSTGKICVSISELLTQKGIENYILFSSKTNGYSLGISCSNKRYIKPQALKSRIFGNYGFNSKYATKKMISELERIQPDIVHIHNIHGHDCNLEMLLGYLKEKKVKVYWTLHDCWNFTGYCTYFTLAKCDKWKTECHNCGLKRSYSWFFDRSSGLYQKKKMAVKGLDLTIITPSQWLAALVEQSFLSEFPVKVINNGIDLNLFKSSASDYRFKNQLENHKIILGVANEWERRKGLDVFIELSKRLPDDYKIVLVGTNDANDKELPSNIISIHRTNNQRELAELYTAADVFVNPTREDNYPTVNMEAIACGTPVITFRTGGSPESIDETTGSVVDCDDIEALEKEIIRICETKPYSVEACLKRAKTFDQNERFMEYISLYKM